MTPDLWTDIPNIADESAPITEEESSWTEIAPEADTSEEL